MMSAGVIDVDQGEVTLPETQTVIAPNRCWMTCKARMHSVRAANNWPFGSPVAKILGSQSGR